MNRQKRERLSQEVKNRRQEFEEAKEKLRGNPQLIEAIESLEGELDALREAVNLDI